ncbi:MAG: CAP domain-containing protein [Jaaginema sp. PMC 1079.18]|nr:CAP domain-containing protein [Jaaginema sp. PMC 1080.18]MEC4849391.1 CAP domain-containing protein [Jaaginema sp. PMC 1079.18]MEC4865424.1 CAP domain-containing protein [Jaaginema sp. PMC 1078.18]
MVRIRFYLQRSAIATAFLSAIAIFGNVPSGILPFKTAAIAQTPDISTLESQVLAEMNRVRTNPQGYANWLAQTKQYYQGRILLLPNQDALPTQEGVGAVDEAIAVLQNMSPLPPLTLSPGMSLGAQDHVNDLGSKGNLGHYGTDGSQFSDRLSRYGESQGALAENLTYGVTSAEAIVMQMIVDDGITGRYHRNNILSDAFSFAGIACGEHQRYQQMCAIAYSQEFRDRLAANPETPEVAVQPLPVANPPVQITPPNPEITVVEPSETLPETQIEELPTENLPENTVELPETLPIVLPPETQIDEPLPENTTAVNPPPATPLEILNEQGILEDGDGVYEQDGSLYDVHQFNGKAGQVLTILVKSSEFDTFLAVFDDNDLIIDQNDDLSDTDTNSSVQITLPRDGTYRIFINGYDAGDRGRYQITVTES